MCQFYEDALRASFIDAALNRLERKRSLFIVGCYGSGKTELMKQIAQRVQTKGKRVVRIDSLAPPFIQMASILSQLNHPIGNPAGYFTSQYLATIQKEKNVVIFIDEVDDLKLTMFKYLKRIMDSGIPVVMAGKETAETMIKEDYRDIYSRLKRLYLRPISREDLKIMLKKFEPEAVELIYAAAEGNMREMFDTIIPECEDKAHESGSEIITAEIAAEFC